MMYLIKDSSIARQVYSELSKQPRLEGLKKLPPHFQKRLELQLEGIMHPKASREEFIQAISQLGAKLYSQKHMLGYGPVNRLSNNLDLEDFVLETDLQMIGKDIEELCKATEVASYSSDSLKYLRFLGGEHLDLRLFLENSTLFLERNKIGFQQVPEEKLAIGRRIRELVQERSKDALRELVLLLQELLHEDLEKYLEGQMLQLEDERNKLFLEEGENQFYPTLFQIADYITKDREKLVEILKEVYPKQFTHKVMDGIVFPSDEGMLLYLEQDHSAPLVSGAQDFLSFFGLYAYPGGGPENLLPFHSKTIFSPGNERGLTGIVLSEPQMSTNQNVGVTVIGNVMLLIGEDESCVQMGLQALFDNLLGIVQMDSHSALIYRVELSRLAFSNNETRDILIDYIQSFVKVGSFYDPEEKLALGTPSIYDAIRERIVDNLTKAYGAPEKEFANSVKSSTQEFLSKIREVAMDMLNKAYKDKVGLTYTEILEPFSKD